MDDLADVMITRCGLDPGNIIRILDAADPMRTGIAVAEAAEQATDVLLVHYVGHGFVSPDGELYLATKATDPRANRLEYNSVRYDTIRKSLLNSSARAIVVILDCCFSGRAIGALSAAEPIDLADVHGACVLASAGRDAVALAPPGEPHTAFTGELIRLLRDGDPHGPPELRVRDVYRTLDRNLRARSLPRPRKLGSERIDDLALAVNAADSSVSASSAGDGLTAASRRPRRKLPALVIIAVIALALSVGPVLWFGVSWAPPHTSQGRPAPMEPVTPSPPEADPSLPSPTACAERSIRDGCGKLPGGAASLAADGHMVILADNSDDTVARYTQSDYTEPVSPNGNLGGGVGDAPVVVPDARGRLIAFAIDTNGVLRHNSNVESEPPQNDWRPISPASGMRGQPAAAQDAKGRLVVFTRDINGTLWRTTQSAPGEYKWNSPEPMPGPPLKDDPTVHQDVNRALRVFALAEDNSVYTWAEDQRLRPEEPWPVQPVGGTKLATSPAVAKDGHQQLQLVALGVDNSLQQITEDPIPNQWPAEWAPISPPGLYEGQPVAATDFDGTVTAFVRRRDPRDKVYSVKASGPHLAESQSIKTRMDRILSVTPDRQKALIVYGTHGGVVVTA
jgi:hypothetical protein